MTTGMTLSKARRALESGGCFAKAAMPEEIAQSWDRCRKSGLDPRAAPEDAVVSHHELTTRRQGRAQLLRIVRPELELLSSQIAGTNFMCAFADETGVVLDAIMDSEFTASACARSVRPGSVWREDLRGTNALGLALHRGRTSIVTGPEHFFACHAAVSCVSAPIFASDGSIAGLLDASSEVSERQVHTAALVNLAATNIENRLFVEAHRGEILLQFHPRAEYLPTQSVGMIALDPEGRITGANRASARLLSGAGFATARHFDDLFRGGFHPQVRRLAQGETLRLSEWMNAGFFARLHPAAPPERAAAPLCAPGAPARVAAPLPRRLIWDDEMVRDALRVAGKAAALGQPICIRGAPGSGKTAFAEAVHGQVQPGAPLISIDCRRLAEAETLGAVLHPAVTSGGGTLVLENVAALSDPAAQHLGAWRADLRQGGRDRAWCVLATESGGPWAGRLVARAGMKMLAVSLPELAARTDFAKIARAMLADLSPEHKLSTRALKVLSAIDRPDNLADLQHHLRVLVATFPAGVMRDSHIAQIFPTGTRAARACPKCEPTPIRRQRCLEIRRMFRECQCNTALTARRLGVSRNTVYAHLKD
ncbi:MAG: hypothetical protein EP318_18800 [Rhodobacteraceae bacterium]|nr:MAG: hypothetical protein EP318_18800 [Paracoccaceae bacterium]